MKKHNELTIWGIIDTQSNVGINQVIMNKAAKVELLTDKELLPQIYQLRVDAWKKSKYGFLVNPTYFPTGMHDSFDQTATHWIAKDNGKIVGSGRVNILSSLDELSQEEANSFKQYIGDGYTNIGLLSRLVIHEDYRYRGLTWAFDRLRLQYLRDNGVRMVIGYANKERLKRLYEYGFIDLGPITVAVGGKFKPYTYTAIMVDLRQANIM